MSTGVMIALIVAVVGLVLVAVVGILAVLGIYGTRKYIANAKTAEARNALGMIAKSAVAAYEAEGLDNAVLPSGAAPSGVHKLCPTAHAVPVNTAMIAAKKYQSSTEDWRADSGWACLKFEMTMPQYYQYAYTNANQGAAFDTVAHGDLNGDGNLSSFELRGSVENDRIVVAPQILETSPEE